MISQAAIRNGGHDLQTFDREAAKLAGIALLGKAVDTLFTDSWNKSFNGLHTLQPQ